MTTDQMAAMSKPDLQCDLIMKGGITSGVVFPKAITRLAERYRFRNVGGTSAGSIAAVMAVAAEYRRTVGTTEEDRLKGFAVIDAMAMELAQSLRTLFQPSPETKPLFTIAMTVIASGGRLSAFAVGALRAYTLRASLGALPGLALLIGAAAACNIWAAVVGAVLLTLIPLIIIALSLWRAVTFVLPGHDYGICSGLAAKGSPTPAFTDWIANKIDEASGRNPQGGPGYRPLTAGDLMIKKKDDENAIDKDRQITVASVTTDLSSGRPYQLPLGTKVFSFRKSEFERLFPARIVDYLVATGGAALIVDENGNDDYFQLPFADKFPILLVARLSLSFPGLISAVPLYRYDYSVRNAAGKRGVLVRCLFSDGGITSNFPIHFFDALLPGRPTFGISLGSLDKREPNGRRIFLPTRAREGSAAAAHAIDGLLNFANAILTTARNWQDTLQSRLHGYRERIVEIRLDDDKEGGLNLDMDEATIKQLADLGDAAAEEIFAKFTFDEHRWRRAVTALPVLAQAMGKFSTVWDAAYRDLLLNFDPESFDELTSEQRLQLVTFADALAAAGAPFAGERLPKASRQRATVRVVARIDTDDD